MKKDIHPKTYEVSARCVCGNTLKIISAEQKVDVHVCSACHPFYTGTEKFIDTAGRIEKFQKRYAKVEKKADKGKSNDK